MSIVTPFFAAIFALFYVLLSLNVVRYRFGTRTSLGSGDNKHFEYAIRAHANFIEYVPLALILIWFIETVTLSAGLPILLGSALLLARIAHAFGMFYPKQLLILRQLGTVVTLGVIIWASVAILQHYLPLSI